MAKEQRTDGAQDLAISREEILGLSELLPNV
jgi:hypothetical protein